MGTYFRGSEGRVLMAFTLSAVIHSVIAACRDVFRPLTHRTIKSLCLSPKPVSIAKRGDTRRCASAAAVVGS